MNTHRDRRGWVPWLAGAVLLLFLVLPLAVTLWGSGLSGLWEAVRAADILRSLGLTFGAAGIATLVALVLGTPLAHRLARREFRGKGLMEGLIELPIVIPHTAAGIALLMVFGRQGLVGRPFGAVGLYFTDNLWGIVLAMLFVGAPFLVISAREAFSLVDPRLESVARTLGASPWRAYYRVALPLAWRGVMAGAVMMWARGISEFGAVVILAYNPKAIPVLIYELFTGYGLSAALPVTALLILVSLGVIVLLRTAIRPRSGSWPKTRPSGGDRA